MAGANVKIRTWHVEIAAVAAVLLTVAIASGGGWIELLGATAVSLTFAHAQVADRLAEKDAARERPSVECHRWAMRYLVSKELLWLVYFVAHRSWAALAGVALFLAYTPWRRWWRQRHPLPGAPAFEMFIVRDEDRPTRARTRTPHRHRVVMPKIDPK